MTDKKSEHDREPQTVSISREEYKRYIVGTSLSVFAKIIKSAGEGQKELIDELLSETFDNTMEIGSWEEKAYFKEKVGDLVIKRQMLNSDETQRSLNDYGGTEEND